MDLTLRINADFEKAQKAFTDLANSSEETKKKMEKFSESFQSKNIDSFIDKQKLLEASLKGTRGETKAMQASVNNYQKEIERLINSGLAPNSEAVRKLAQEQEKLKQKIKETNDIQKMQETLMKGVENVYLGLWKAIGAGVAATGYLTQKTAELGDELKKTSQRTGVSVEALQELDYAAKQNGVKDIKTHFDKLNVTMGEIKSGTGNLTKYLKDNDKQLLDQLKNVKSNDEAFMLLMDSISKAPDEFTKARLAQEYFGKSGKELIIMANQGTEGIQALREEAQKYGIMSTEAAKASEDYLTAQDRLRTSLQGVATELTTQLMPCLSEIINKVAEFIASIDDWDKIIKIVGYSLAGLTAGLTAFLVITKGKAAIEAMTTAFKALNAAMKANPVVFIASIITAVLVPALIYLIKNWDTVQTYLQQGVAALEFGFKWLASQIKEKLIIAFNAIKIAAATLLDFIVGNIVRGVGKLLEALGNLPGDVGKMFAEASDKVNALGNSIADYAAQVKQNSLDAMQAAKNEQDAAQTAYQNKLDLINAEAQARRAELEEAKTRAAEEIQLKNEVSENEISMNEALAESSNNLKDTKIKNLKEELKTEEEILNMKLDANSQFLNGMGSLLGEAGKQNKDAAIAQKGISMVETAINTARAISQTIAQYGFTPWGIAAAAGAAAMGAAQELAIATASFETGTGDRFIVPRTNSVDGALVRVNQGEEINVRTRGNSGGENFNFVFKLNERTFAEIINKQARAGELYTLQLAA